MFVARRVNNGLDETVFVGVDVCLKAIGAGLLAVGGDFDVITGLAILGIFTLGILAWPTMFGFDSGRSSRTLFAVTKP
jgi:hypothetical protein